MNYDNRIKGTMTNPESQHVELTISSTLNKDDALSQAVDELIPTAAARRHGILVRRISPTTYTVEVDASVPYGLVLESSE